MTIRPNVIVHEDGKARCPWPGTDPLYVTYHDTDWGVPELDDRALFEKLILDGFQAGLSWITILRKRENFRETFHHFDPQQLVHWGPENIEAAMMNTGIVRNRSKILGTIAGAKAYLSIQERGGFSNFIWDAVDGHTVQNTWTNMSQVPTQTAASLSLSKKLKAEGFNFVGPTIVYAFMQACGLVNDHMVDCFRHQECAALARTA